MLYGSIHNNDRLGGRGEDTIFPGFPQLLHLNFSSPPAATVKVTKRMNYKSTKFAERVINVT